MAQALIMGFPKAMTFAPHGVPMSDYGVRTEEAVLQHLFKRKACKGQADSYVLLSWLRKL